MDDQYGAQNAGLMGLGGAVKGALQGWQDAEDRQQKRLEMTAKLEAMKQQKERSALQDKMDLKEKGLQQDPLSGALTDAPITDRQRDQQQLSGMEKGISTSYGENGRPTYRYDPNSPQSIAAHAREGMGMNRQDVIDTRHDRMDRAEHEHVLTRINSNPQVRARLQQYQNLDNALSQLANADHITPQQFHEVQQSIRANLGIKGSSGIAERESAYLQSMGLNAANLQQFLTGSPASMNPNDPFLVHIKNLAAVEQKNIRQQFDQSLKAASGGHSSMYDRRPDLRGDLEDYITGVSGQMQAPPPSEAPPPQGLMQQEHPGLLSRIGGMLGFGQKAEAGAPVANQPPMDPQIATWAKEHNLDYNAAAQIIANRKARP